MFSLTTRSVCGTPAGCLQTAQGCYPIAASARVLGLDAMPDAVIDLFRDWPANLRRLARIATAENELRALDVPGDAPELAPLQYPGKVLCAGANYYDHLAEMKVPDAHDLNRAPEAFYKFDWVAGKAHDTSCPLGRLVPACFVEDPHDLAMRLEVNGETRQDANTSGMIFDIGEQLATLSRIMTLEPGDVVLTGTPAGVGASRRSFLSAGDVVTARIGALGSLRVEIQPPRP